MSDEEYVYDSGDEEYEYHSEDEGDTAPSPWMVSASALIGRLRVMLGEEGPRKLSYSERDIALFKDLLAQQNGGVNEVEKIREVQQLLEPALAIAVYNARGNLRRLFAIRTAFEGTGVELNDVETALASSRAAFHRYDPSLRPEAELELPAVLDAVRAGSVLDRSALMKRLMKDEGTTLYGTSTLLKNSGRDNAELRQARLLMQEAGMMSHPDRLQAVHARRRAYGIVDDDTEKQVSEAIGQRKHKARYEPAATALQRRFRAVRAKYPVCAPCTDGTEGSISVRIREPHSTNVYGERVPGALHCVCYMPRALRDHVVDNGWVDPTIHLPYTDHQIRRLKGLFDKACLGVVDNSDPASGVVNIRPVVEPVAVSTYVRVAYDARLPRSLTERSTYICISDALFTTLVPQDRGTYVVELSFPSGIVYAPLMVLSAGDVARETVRIEHDESGVHARPAAYARPAVVRAHLDATVVETVIVGNRVSTPALRDALELLSRKNEAVSLSFVVPPQPTFLVLKRVDGMTGSVPRATIEAALTGKMLSVGMVFGSDGPGRTWKAQITDMKPACIGMLPLGITTEVNIDWTTYVSSRE